jgi:phage FluMu protein Com
VIRFSCPHCDKHLKASERKAGATVVCPRCERICTIPLESPENDPGGHLCQPGGYGSAASSLHGEEAPSLFSGMSLGVQGALAVAVAVGVLSLLLAFVGPLVPPLASLAHSSRYGTMTLAPLSVIAVLTILYGHGTSCPLCGRWWARREARKEFVEKEEFEKEGVPFARSIYRTSYQCESCRHGWSVTSTEEFKKCDRDRARPRLG